MRFGDVYHQKRDALLILLVQLVESGNLPPKWRSSVAAEDQHDGLALIQNRKPHLPSLVELKKRKIWRGVSQVEFTGTGMKPCSFKGEKKKWNWARHSLHHSTEGFWRLIHRPPDHTAEKPIQYHQNYSRPHQAFADRRP